MAELRVSVEGAEDKFVPLADKAVTLGRADDNDVVLAEQKASRRHCRVEPKDGGWRVVDEGSANGTLLGGKPVIAARLKPDDELTIGGTVITFVDDAAPEAAPVSRRPRAKKKPTPWGALLVPVLAGAAVFGVVYKVGGSEDAAAASSFTQFASAEIERAALQADAGKRAALLTDARNRIDRLQGSQAAVQLLDDAIAGRAAATGPVPDGPKHDDDWRAALATFDADKTTSSAQRRATLATLLERNVTNAEASAAIRDRFRAELTSAGERVRRDREDTFAAADAAANDGRFGAALDLWTHWIARAPAISPEDETAIARRMFDLIEKSGAAAREAAAAYETARKEGRAAAAQSALDAAIERLSGTGYDVWLAARAGTEIHRTGGKTPVAEKPDDPSAKERTRALQIKAAGEQLARERHLDDAALKMDEATTSIQAASLAALKGEIALRAADLRAESAFLAKLAGWIAADTKKFSPLKMGEHKVRVAAATPTELSVLDKDGNPEPHPFSELQPAVFGQLVEMAAIDRADFIPAALLLNDVGEQEGFIKWMRQALTTEDNAARMAASEVYARCTGAKMPADGFVPHSGDTHLIVTVAEDKAFRNAKLIAARRDELTKWVVKIEKSKQAKDIEAVRKDYKTLEAARSHALELIFDEVKYFYPYRDRMKEYAPVQHDVDERVKAVRDAWEVTTKRSIRSDAALDEMRQKSDALVTEIQYLQGDPDDLVKRIEAVTMYLPERSEPGATSATGSSARELTVQTFFENQADLDLLTYNAKVMKYNPGVKGPSDPERKQVEITNEYRIMFGHRRAVRINPMLVNSAHGHSDDMSKLGFFDHFSPVPGKRAPEDRMKLAGYDLAGGSENIYQGSGSPEAAHEGWIHSSGHHRNLLATGWLEMGSGNSGNCWTQNFGFRLDDDWK